MLRLRCFQRSWSGSKPPRMSRPRLKHGPRQASTLLPSSWYEIAKDMLRLKQLLGHSHSNAAELLRYLIIDSRFRLPVRLAQMDSQPVSS